LKSSPLSLGVNTNLNENRLPIKKNKPDHHSNRQRDYTCLDGTEAQLFAGREALNKICGHKKEKQMKFTVHLSRPALVYACALSLFPTLTWAQHYQQANLVSNVPVTPAATVTDPNLLNAWGLVHGPTTPWWISNNTGGTSTLYNTSGLNPANPAQTPAPVLPPVTIIALNGAAGTPENGVKILPAPNQSGSGSPTTTMFNGSPTNFLLDATHQATFLWATLDGTIQGWNSAVNATTAVIKVDKSQIPTKTNGAVYTGATIAGMNGKEYILAANFRSGRIDVFDSNFKQLRLPEWVLNDNELPRGFAPFNVQGIGNNIYVTYAQQDAAKHDPMGGAGVGYVAIFNDRGRKIAHLEHGDWFNAPWGVVLAPANFGVFSHAILVGNLIGGNIAAFNPLTGRYIGSVLNPDGTDVKIDGLWALVFGNGGASGPGNTLFFTAGPDRGANGLFGTLTPVTAELQADDVQ
jgi:uncharacterized protein (TIGR03118 family)